MARHLDILEDPHLLRGKASSPFDDEGVRTQRRKVLSAGKLQTYFLSSYSARKLGMRTTGHAGGSHNLFMTSRLTQPGDDLDAIVGALADTGKSLAKAAVKAARDIADPDPVPMFDAVPSHFPVMLPEHGLTWMTKDDPATLGKHVKQFARETHRFGEQVARRGKRLAELVEPLADDRPAGDQMRALDVARRDELAQ
jgi:hypothetical protein